MKFKSILNSIKKATKKNAPELYLAAGIGLGIVSIVETAKATPKAKEVLDEIN